ncbi:MAG TPA: type II secretion system minor pseudopilin GspH [Steroidobacteraceae bacterium]|jgi:general secretion pathway protein H|nr:type II secretion system minor pseudopilin GspH [Steroidobacteraceae bacterium]
MSVAISRQRSVERSRGFTLIEILVVVFIIGILVSVTLISIHTLGRDTEIRDETARLVALIGAVHEQAEMEGRDFGLRLQEREYEFLAYDARRDVWQAVDGDDLLRPRQLPAGLNLRLRLDGRDAVLRAPADTKKPWPPQVQIQSSGDLSAFELKLQREDSDHEATITGDANGELEVKNVDDQK